MFSSDLTDQSPNQQHGGQIADGSWFVRSEESAITILQKGLLPSDALHFNTMKLIFNSQGYSN
jgi:hypothetical protein